MLFRSRGIWDAAAAGNSYGNMSTYSTGVNSWQGWGISNDFTYMGRNDTDHGLYTTGYGWGWYQGYGGLVGYRTSTTSSSYPHYFTGNIYTDGSVTAASDVRNKKDIQTIENALDKVTQLRGVTYKRIDFEDGDPLWNKTHMGVIAQEVEPIVPEVVIYAKDVDKYSVSYDEFAGLFIEAFKEQQEQINTMKKEIEELKKRLGE